MKTASSTASGQPVLREFDDLLGDGQSRIGERAVRQFIGKIGAEVLEPELVDRLTDRFVANEDSFGPAAQRRLQQFLTGRGGTGYVTDPKITDDALRPKEDPKDVARYRHQKGQMF